MVLFVTLNTNCRHMANCFLHTWLFASLALLVRRTGSGALPLQRRQQDPVLYIIKWQRTAFLPTPGCMHAMQDMARWRAENAVDTILERESFPEQDALLEVLPMFYHKQDKFGRPIYIELLGRADASKLLQAMSIERLLTYHIYSWERYHRYIKHIQVR